MSASPSACPTMRVRGEDGMTLVELLVVLVIMSILMTIVVGGFVGLRDRGETSAAEIHVRSAIAAAEAYYSERDTYTGMTIAGLNVYARDVRLSREPVVSADGRRYCIESTHNGNSTSAPTKPGKQTHSLQGPGGEIEPGACPGSL